MRPRQRMCCNRAGGNTFWRNNFVLSHPLNGRSRMDAKDLTGIGQPLTKLVEVVSSAIGTLYKPKAIRNETDARAYEARAMAKAEADAAEIRKEVRISGTLSRIDQVLRDRPDLAERARNRLLAREVEGQLNIEAIADVAANALPPTVSEAQVSADWRRKFFIEAENVCDADLQELWGRVLAGEVAQPGKFGLRTLDTLRQLSRAEAEHFRKACAIAMQGGWIAVPHGNLNTGLKAFGLSYSDVLSLRDAGLVMDGDSIHKDFSRAELRTDGTPYPVVLFNNGTLIEISGPIAGLRIPALLFTQSGRELQSLNPHSPTPDYFSSIGSFLRARGFVVKRGTESPQPDGVTTVVTFEQDL